MGCLKANMYSGVLQICAWFPAQFAELRRICLSQCGGEAAFCASLSRCHRCVFLVLWMAVLCPQDTTCGVDLFRIAGLQEDLVLAICLWSGPSSIS